MLNLNVCEEEERKRAILGSSRKRADIFYTLKWKPIVLVLNKLVCVMSTFYYFIFYVVSQDFKANNKKCGC